jgi:hypothetical protein
MLAEIDRKRAEREDGRAEAVLRASESERAAARGETGGTEIPPLR